MRPGFLAAKTGFEDSLPGVRKRGELYYQGVTRKLIGVGGGLSDQNTDILNFILMIVTAIAEIWNTGEDMRFGW